MHIMRVSLEDLSRLYLEERGLAVKRHVAGPVADPVSRLSDNHVERLLAGWKRKVQSRSANVSCKVVNEVPAILRQMLRTDSPISFPNGETGHGAWEFGLMGSLPEENKTKIIQLIADRAYERLSCLMSRETVMLVCFGSAMHECGKRIASLLVDRAQLKVHVVLAENYYSPRLWCRPRELKGRTVVLLVDVVHSGGLMARLRETCTREEPKRIILATVIDQSVEQCQVGNIVGLWREKPEERISSNDPAVRDVGMRYFDPELSCSTSVVYEDSAHGLQPDSPRYDSTDFGDLLPFIEKTDALRADAKVCGAQYPWVLDLLDLMADDGARELLLSKATDAVADLQNTGKWCIVYPAERARRAGIWAKLLASRLGWAVVPVGLASRKHFRPLTEAQHRELSCFDGIAVADAAIRTGETLRSFVCLARTGAGKTARVVGLYAFDALAEATRERIETELGVSVRSAYRFPLGPPTESVQDVCYDLLRNTLKELKGDLSSIRAHPWKNTIAEYCNRRLHVSCRFPHKEPSPKDKIAQALAEFRRGPQARIEQSNVHARPGIVKHLDARTALGDPRIRRAIHGFLCNSMPPDFIEWCGLALSSQRDFTWFDSDWLTLHRRILGNRHSRRWEFLLCIAFWMKQDGNPSSIQKARNAVEHIKRRGTDGDMWLFKESIPEDRSVDSLVEARCKELLSVLS